MAVLVAALSGRSLAQAARRAGATCLVADFFGDADTREAAAEWTRLPGSLAEEIDAAAFLALLAEHGGATEGLVYGAGFEAQPALLEAAAERTPLLGNRGATVAAVKDPVRLAALFAECRLPHPEISLDAPPDPAGWLRKSVGGSGGGHVVPADRAGGERAYYQRRVPGEAVSALFAADGRRARLVGFSAQWCDASAAAPFRYGGCAGPIALPDDLVRRLAAACDALVAATGLVGLNSLDLLLADDASFHALEINPRPGATLDVFDELAAVPLWRLHLDGVAGRLPERVLLGDGARAASLLYAPAPLNVDSDIVWPRWTADRPPPGARIATGEPVCTVIAAAADAASARAAAERRRRSLLAALPFGAPVPSGERMRQ